MKSQPTWIAVGCRAIVPLAMRTPQIAAATIEEIDSIVAWYVRSAFGKWEGPGIVPFFADAARVGPFAVDSRALAARDPEALFKLLVTLSAYQSRRDVDIMRIQRKTGSRPARAMTSPRRLRVLVEQSRCLHLRAASEFDEHCDVRRDFARGGATCDSRPRTACHVKEATAAIGRMGDLGKTPTSAWLHLGSGDLHRWFVDACRAQHDPQKRATSLVERAATIHRIGTKLASMFVTALSVPELGIGAPWWPEIDGSRIVVIDANVGNAIRSWRRGRGPATYGAMSRWMITAAEHIDLSRHHRSLPPRSPRFVQQAIYVFRSRSNRAAVSDPCATRACPECPSRVCPFHADDPRANAQAEASAPGCGSRLHPNAKRSARDQVPRNIRKRVW